jgi:hypothetical protein
MARHHESKKEARRHEHAGMERYERGPLRGHYEGHDGRRHDEMRDGGMINEDHNAIANMPQHVMIKPWPAGGSYLPEGLDDSISGINRQMEKDDSKRSEYMRPHKV